MTLAVQNPERRSPPGRGWPKPKYVPGRIGNKKWRVRQTVAGHGRPTMWGTDDHDALDAWKAWWHAGCPPPERRKRTTTSLPASDADARKVPPATMAELFTRYLDEHQPPILARGTWKRYEGDFRRDLIDRFGSEPFPIDRQVLQDWITDRIRANAPTTSIKRSLATVQSALAWALERGWITVSPAAHLAAPRPRARVRALQARDAEPDARDIPSREEVGRLLRAARDAKDPLYAMWRVMFALGLRPGEACAMSVDQMLKGPSGAYEVLAVHQKLIRDTTTPEPTDEEGTVVPRSPGELILERPKWEGFRDIEIDPDDELWVVLATQAMRMRALAAEHGWDTDDDRWRRLLFRHEPGPRRRLTAGQPWAPDTIGAEFRKACERAGWPATRTPYHARHFAASNFLRHGFSAKAASAILGHKTQRTFDETYAHVLREVGYGKRISDALVGLESAGLGSGLGSIRA